MIAVNLRPLIGCAVIGALAALGLVYTLDRDTTALPRPTATITPLPGWADTGGPVPAYEDERYQDPSGLPYCVTPDDGLRPCIDAQTQIIVTNS